VSQAREYIRPEDIRITPLPVGEPRVELLDTPAPVSRPEFAGLCRQRRRKLERAGWRAIERGGGGR
jgi:hypothetical protein